MIEDFKLAVGGFGGAPFRRLGTTPWAAPLLGAQERSSQNASRSPRLELRSRTFRAD